MSVVDVEVDLMLLGEAEGGRRSPVRSRYRPNLRFHDGRFDSGQIELQEGDSIAPGESRRVVLKLWDPDDIRSRLAEGITWQVTEGAHVVGTAKFVRIL